MTHRKFDTLTRLSGRPPSVPRDPEPQTVFRRFFGLLERLERPGQPEQRTPSGASAPSSSRNRAKR